MYCACGTRVEWMLPQLESLDCEYGQLEIEGCSFAIQPIRVRQALKAEAVGVVCVAGSKEVDGYIVSGVIDRVAFDG
jgi:hypothetical protein